MFVDYYTFLFFVLFLNNEYDDLNHFIIRLLLCNKCAIF